MMLIMAVCVFLCASRSAVNEVGHTQSARSWLSHWASVKWRKANKMAKGLGQAYSEKYPYFRKTRTTLQHNAEHSVCSKKPVWAIWLFDTDHDRDRETYRWTDRTAETYTIFVGVFK